MSLIIEISDNGVTRATLMFSVNHTSMSPGDPVSLYFIAQAMFTGQQRLVDETMDSNQDKLKPELLCFYCISWFTEDDLACFPISNK